ncbi:Csu type fimbrial protein [Ciceribacter thiooxidans]|uniref:Spore coat U domain-containing protein n=1 Tax=Ciceribacter thiooxidans TaxID=1969821 RepID=A0ABV7I5K1_9HYPH|nr:spore coat U domain-containing protein [Ciceribacter thiooxidans]
MRLSFLTAFALLAGVPLLAGPAQAQTATDIFTVRIQITAECLINSTTTLNFGASGVLSSATTGTSEITVQCTNGTTYNVGLNEGLGIGATVASRRMTGPGSATVTYSLYSDVAHTTVWGQTIGTDTVSGTGTGASQVYTVYGQVPAQSTPAAGTYSDTITVTVTY